MKRIVSILVFTLISSFVIGQTKNMGENVNSIYHEIRPVVSEDGSVIYFTVEGSPKGKTKDGQDIYMSIKDSDGQWSKASRLPDQINSQIYNGVYWCSPDGKKILIRGGKDVTTNEPIRGFSIVRFENGEWLNPEPIIVKDYELISRGKYTGATLSPDEKVLIMYFATDINEEDNDLWISKWIDSLGIYSRPEILSLSEADYDEMSPYISPDGKTLFYSSNRPGGLGGYDIWMSKRIDDSWNYWTKPQNLGEPFNSKSWDAYFSIGDNGTVGYTSTNRKYSVPSNVGGADLVYDTLPFYLVPEKSLIKLNKDLAGNEKNNNISDNSSNDNYSPQGDSPFGQKDITVIRDTIYITQTIPCNPLDTMNDEQLNLELKKSKILFDFGSSILRSDAYYKLDVIATMMKRNPKMKIELGGHTDAIGYSKRNQIQSEERAESAKRYLTARGVPVDRITTKGYSNKKPVASNETDDGRQLNRRVDIIVISE